MGNWVTYWGILFILLSFLKQVEKDLFIEWNIQRERRLLLSCGSWWAAQKNLDVTFARLCNRNHHLTSLYQKNYDEIKDQLLSRFSHCQNVKKEQITIVPQSKMPSNYIFRID